MSRAEEDDEGREGRNDAAWGADDYDGAPGCQNDDDDNGDCRPPSTWMESSYSPLLSSMMMRRARAVNVVIFPRRCCPKKNGL